MTDSRSIEIDDELSLHEQHEAAADLAAKRVTFQLTYGRATDPRKFDQFTLSGPWIPNAYGPGHQVGEWSGGDRPEDPTEDGWIDEFASWAINEAVHEALEWFRVDGRPWLDPHGLSVERDVFRIVNNMCGQLAALRRRTEEGTNP